MDTMPTVLACDVGNTTIRFAEVCGQTVTNAQAIGIGDLAGLGETLRQLWANMTEPKKIAAGSVNAEGLKALEATVAKDIDQEVLVVGRDLPLPIETDLDNPSATGTDRLCAAAAAFDHLGVACVVADFGTAITIDCVNSDGIFLGGAIMPGLRIGADSLARHTCQLPKVELAEPDWVFGKDTNQAIVGGLIISARGALREFAEAYATEIGQWPAVVITGATHISFAASPANPRWCSVKSTISRSGVWR